MRRQPLVMRDTCPASDVTVAGQSQSPDITSSPRMPQVGEDVFQGQFQLLIGVHVGGVTPSSPDRCKHTACLGQFRYERRCSRELWPKGGPEPMNLFSGAGEKAWFDSSPLALAYSTAPSALLHAARLPFVAPTAVEDIVLMFASATSAACLAAFCAVSIALVAAAIADLISATPCSVPPARS